MDHKKSTLQALQKYHQRQINQGVTREPKRKNKQPEKDTQKQVMSWAKDNGVFLHVIESSSYDPRLGRRGIQKAQSGFSDLVGNTSEGLTLYIELKAKDRRSNLSELQRQFLESKIDQSCFAVVVDSRARLEQYWKGFWSLKNPSEKVIYLKNCLPKKKNAKDQPLFKSE